ncbi:MAG: 4-(cytidine 5'-diphospho)-2-C-methyl-D-erythritol kinase [Pseudomonadota bacterium]
MTTSTPLALVEDAPAKVNLFLHLRGLRADGYHLIESLVVFPQIGDVLWAEPSDRVSLSVSGPFGDGLSTDVDNLVLRAAAALAAGWPGRGAVLRLAKNLPVASGIGGGSSDAAAALRLLSRLWGCSPPPGLAPSLGADVPVCIAAPQPQIMTGIGEQVTPAPPLPPCWIVLANPREPVETRAVFAATPQKKPPPAPLLPGTGFSSFGAFAEWLRTQRNDLAEAAEGLCPPIGAVLASLSGAPVARMSGSGATCFALHASAAAAAQQAASLRRAQPGWWVADAEVTTAPTFRPDRQPRPL